MAMDETGRDPDGAEDARLESLEERLRSAQRNEAVRLGKARGKPARGYSQGNRVLAELIGAPAGGALIGWLLDRWLATSPWLLLVMLALGIGVGFRNIFRISRERPE